MKVDIKNLLERGVVDVIVREDLEKKLLSKKKLRIKFGIDPTGAELHIGHAVVLKKLREFQNAGHQAILLIGDYTARIGDPTGKSETRKTLTQAEIETNMKDYIKQASKILDIDRLEIRYNSEWFEKMTMADILELTGKKSVQQILQREDFKNRLKNDQDISGVELLYPMMQGYDSVMLESDLELGGTDQLFNVLVGRDLQKRYNKKNIQDVLVVPILEGLDGVEKMSKSLNNYIGLMESSNEMYGKTLSIPDNMILKYFELATNISLDEISTIKQTLDEGENPKNLKMRLAREIVTLYHNKEEAQKAEQQFIEIFSNKGLPQDIHTLNLPEKDWNIIDLIVKTGFAASKGEARRLIDSGGVKVENKKIESVEAKINLSKEKLLQVGKRKFIKVISNAG